MAVPDRYEEAFYPGSKTPVRDYSREKYGEPPETELGEPIATEQGIPYYPVSELALLLNRAVGSLRRWEDHGDLPYARRSASDSKNGAVRLYTRQELEGLAQIAYEEGLIANPRRKVSTTRFRERAAKLYESLGG